MTTAVVERTATPSFTETDARAAVAAIIAAEGVPAPQSVLMNDSRPTHVYVRVATRDEVDEWAAMFCLDTYRARFAYSTRWDEQGTHELVPGVTFEVFCDVAPVQWRSRQTAQVAA